MLPLFLALLFIIREAEIRLISKLEYNSSKKLSDASVFFGSELLAKIFAPFAESTSIKPASSICSLSENPFSEYEVNAAVCVSGRYGGSM